MSTCQCQRKVTKPAHLPCSRSQSISGNLPSSSSGVISSSSPSLLCFIHDASSRTSQRSHPSSSVARKDFPCVAQAEESCIPHSSSSALTPTKNAVASNSQRPKRGRPPKALSESAPTVRSHHIGRPRGSGPKQKAKAKAELLGNVSPLKKRPVGRPRKANAGGGKVTVRVLTEKIVCIFLFQNLFSN
jgi:hypothetical protein